MPGTPYDLALVWVCHPLCVCVVSLVYCRSGQMFVFVVQGGKRSGLFGHRPEK